MKNKEIEEILNNIKFEYKNKEKWITDMALSADAWSLLLSYIEQLQNNRDKVIEVITNLKPLTEKETGIKEMLKLAYSADNIKNLETSFKTICHLEDFEIAIWNIKDILKGDSDE